jgi:sporulation protein YlmC with PRC-barrel domain
MRSRIAKLRLPGLLAMLSIAAVCGAPTPALTQTPAPAQPATPQPTAPQPAVSSPAPAQGATPASVVDDKDVESILGREIYSATGEDMGKIVDVLVDHTGQVRAAIIDFGGFLGVGTRKIAVDWRAMKFAPNVASDRIVLSLTRDQVRLAPEYKQGEPVVVLGAMAQSPPAAATPAKASTMPADTAPSK